MLFYKFFCQTPPYRWPTPLSVCLHMKANRRPTGVTCLEAGWLAGKVTYLWRNINCFYFFWWRHFHHFFNEGKIKKSDENAFIKKTKVMKMPSSKKVGDRQPTWRHFHHFCFSDEGIFITFFYFAFMSVVGRRPSVVGRRPVGLPSLKAVSSRPKNR